MKELEVTLECSESTVVLHLVVPVDSNTAVFLQEPLLHAAELFEDTHAPACDAFTATWYEFEFAPAAEQTNANVVEERLDGILTSFGYGVWQALVLAHIRIVSEVSSGEVLIRLSSRQPITPAALSSHLTR